MGDTGEAAALADLAALKLEEVGDPRWELSANKRHRAPPVLLSAALACVFWPSALQGDTEGAQNLFRQALEQRQQEGDASGSGGAAAPSLPAEDDWEGEAHLLCDQLRIFPAKRLHRTASMP